MKRKPKYKSLAHAADSLLYKPLALHLTKHTGQLKPDRPPFYLASKNTKC